MIGIERLPDVKLSIPKPHTAVSKAARSMWGYVTEATRNEQLTNLVLNWAQGGLLLFTDLNSPPDVFHFYLVRAATDQLEFVAAYGISHELAVSNYDEAFASIVGQHS